MSDIQITPVASKADRQAFIDLPFRLYADDPHWVPPLKAEVNSLLTPGDNPWYEHGHLQLYLARRGERVVGRISAHIDDLWLARMGAGNWGMFEAEDAEVGAALIRTAEDWLRGEQVSLVHGPISLSIWDEPGLLVSGFDTSPTVMMGHNLPTYEAMIEAVGYSGAKDLHCWEVDIRREYPPLIQRIIRSGEQNPRINIRQVDKSRFAEEAAIILNILNDAWGDNWGFVPLTESEIAYVGKKLKPIVFNDLIRIAEVDGEPVAFMITLPDINELTRDLNGSLFPFGWAKLLWRLRKPKVDRVRVPLMGVVKRLQATRLASQLAFMMIEFTRRDALTNYGTTRGEIGWILEDNEPMRSIAKAIDSEITRTYRIYEKAL